MNYNLTYDPNSEPKDIKFELTAITQSLIDYLLANNSLQVIGRNGYSLTINRSGTNILGQFDNGGIVIFIAEDADPDFFSPIEGHIYGYENEDKVEVEARVTSVMSQIPAAILPE